MSREERRVALVTGASKGIGLAIAEGLAKEGLVVLLSARSKAKADAAAVHAGRAGRVTGVELDVASDASVGAAFRAIEADHGRLDVLVNDAGVLLDEGTKADALEPALLETTLETNLFGAVRCCRAALPLMRRGRYGRVVNVSSSAGSFADMASPAEFGDFEAPAYRVSKAALNAYTVMLARAVRRENVLVNAMCPGWVRTDMGGPSAPLTPKQGADTAIWLATLPDSGPRGGFFQSRAPHAW
jgi:NAD(P)-dependent dehydrogenase (short-subunit alcohol dehydrogenase family)